MAHPLLNAILNRLSSIAAVQHIEAESLVGELTGNGGEQTARIEPVWFVFAVIGYSPSEGFHVECGSHAEAKVEGNGDSKKDSCGTHKTDASS